MEITSSARWLCDVCAASPLLREHHWLFPNPTAAFLRQRPWEKETEIFRHAAQRFHYFGGQIEIEDLLDSLRRGVQVDDTLLSAVKSAGG